MGHGRGCLTTLCRKGKWSLRWTLKVPILVSRVEEFADAVGYHWLAICLIPTLSPTIRITHAVERRTACWGLLIQTRRLPYKIENSLQRQDIALRRNSLGLGETLSNAFEGGQAPQQRTKARLGLSVIELDAACLHVSIHVQKGGRGRSGVGTLPNSVFSTALPWSLLARGR